MQAMSWGATDCYRLWKTPPENNMTTPVITSEKGREMNHTTGFIDDISGAPPPYPQLVLSPLKEKRPRGISKRQYDIAGYVASRMDRYGQSRSERMSIIHNRL